MLSVKIDIAESAEELSELLEQETDEQRCQKLRTLYFLKTQKVKTVRHIAQILNLHRSTVGGWLRLYRQGGLENLLKNYVTARLGSDETDWLADRLVAEFRHSPILPSTKAVQTWAKKELSIEIGHGKAYKMICEKLTPAWLADKSTRTGEVGANESIQTAINSVVYKRFEQWKNERGLSSTSEALEQLIGEFFGIRTAWCLRSLDRIDRTLIESIAKRSLQIHVPHTIPDLLSQNRLSERLGIHNSVLYRNRNRRTFSGWTRRQDPDNVGWQWVPRLRKYKALIHKVDRTNGDSP